ncbi:DUF4488 domain-containing protein [Niabella beijingensis]|uniref:DUF4488 domain-containing protein n=1 Tax=Niabella beijingensis TaxID=2872700 RepID=UPI001CBD4A72|nr:DUF4488 domain-containing protein [Niabella beijingensis]MBZ4189597.1 DUF4488 domain-containing protein [Niabella beijingensis]
MKKRFFLIPGMALLLMALAPQPQNPLLGIWELQMEGASTGLLKQFNADGTTINIGLGDEGFGISLEGTYELRPSGRYVEKTIRSSFGEQNGTQKLVQYRLAGDSLLHLSYKVEGKSFTEEYKKLKLIGGQ